MTKHKEGKATAPEVAPRNDSPNPPTEQVPEEGAPPYPPEDATELAPVEAAPVWEGGDPGTAVPSPNDDENTYAPVNPPPPEPPEDPVDDDETPPAQPDITLPPLQPL